MDEIRYLPMFDSVEAHSDKPAGRRSLLEWARANPKKAILFTCLTALGVVLVVFLGLCLALLPVMRTSVDPATLRVRLSDLCSSSSSYSVDAALLNPSSVAVEVTRVFTVSIGRGGVAIAEVDVQPFVMQSGRTALNTTSQWRVINTTEAGLLLGDVIANSTSAKVRVSLSLPIRVYGGIALTLPLSFELDVTSSPPGSTTPGMNVSMTDVGASSDASSLEVRAGAAVSPVPVIEADVPRINLTLSDSTSRSVGSATVDPFSIRAGTPVTLRASFLSQLALLPQLQLAVKSFGEGLVIRGAPDDACMIGQVLQHLKYVVPSSSNATAARSSTRAAADSSLSASSSFFPMRLASAAVAVAQEMTATVSVTGVDIVGPIPTLSFGFAGLGRINVNGGGSSISAQAVPDEAAVAALVQQLSAPSLYVTGVEDPASNLLSRALALLNYSFAKTVSSAAAPFVLAISGADASTLSCTASLRDALTMQGIVIGLSVAPASIQVARTATPTAAVARATLAVSGDNVLSLAVMVSDFAGARGALQPALDNATSSVTVSGDPADTNVLGRILKRVQRVEDLRARLNDASGTPSTGRKPIVSLASLQPTSFALAADLAALNLTFVSGELPPVSLDFVYQANAMATVQFAAQLPRAATLGGTIVPTLCAQLITDALTAGKSPGALQIRGSPSTAASNVLQRLADGLMYAMDTASAANSPSFVSLSAVVLQGDSGSTAGKPANIVVDLALSYTATNSFFRGDLPAVSAGLRVGAGETVVVSVPPLSFAPNTPFPAVVSVSLLVSGPAQLSDGVTQVLSSKALQVAVRAPAGAPPSTNVLQSIVNALQYQYTLQPPSGATKGVLPSIQSRYLSSSAAHLAVVVMYDFTLNTTMEIQHGDASLTAVYQGNTIASVALDQTKPFANKLVGGKNTLGATVTVTADTPSKRTAFETFASAAFQDNAAPLTLTGLLASTSFRFAPVRFSYDFVLPKGSSGGNNALMPCFEVGLTTPFDSSWRLGSCVPIVSTCKCGGLNTLCTTGPCDGVAINSRCVDLKLSIMIHFYVANVLPVKLRLHRASIDVFFDYMVAAQSSFSNTRNTPNVLLARINTDLPTNNAVLNTLPLLLGLNESAVVSGWLRNQHLAPPPAGTLSFGKFCCRCCLLNPSL